MTEAEVYAGLTEIFHELFGDEAIVAARRRRAPPTFPVGIPSITSTSSPPPKTALRVKLGTSREIEALPNVGDLARLILAKRAR